MWVPKKKSPGHAEAFLTYAFPRLLQREFSSVTKVVQRGKTRATKWHEPSIQPMLLARHSGCTAQACDGFPSPSQVPPQLLWGFFFYVSRLTPKETALGDVLEAVRVSGRIVPSPAFLGVKHAHQVRVRR
jgi:hypothetical protein